MGNKENKSVVFDNLTKMQLLNFLDNKKTSGLTGQIFAKEKKNSSYISRDDFELIESIENAKKEWLDADANFQYVSDDEIIDYYTYIIKAAQIKYEYYLKKAKKRGLLTKVYRMPLN